MARIKSSGNVSSSKLHSIEFLPMVSNVGSARLGLSVRVPPLSHTSTYLEFRENAFHDFTFAAANISLLTSAIASLPVASSSFECDSAFKTIELNSGSSRSETQTGPHTIHPLQGVEDNPVM